MTWGPYWMYYTCETCAKKYKYSVEEIHLKEFGYCPMCKKEGDLVAESKDNPADANTYEEVSAF